MLCGRGTWTINKTLEETESRNVTLEESSEKVVKGKSYKWKNIRGNGDMWEVSENYQETCSISFCNMWWGENGWDLCLTTETEEREVTEPRGKYMNEIDGWLMENGYFGNCCKCPERRKNGSLLSWPPYFNVTAQGRGSSVS